MRVQEQQSTEVYMFGKIALITAVNFALGIAAANAGNTATGTTGAAAAGNTSGSMAAEVSTETKARFRKLDKNGDGAINKSEAKANPRLEVGCKDYDSNKNGKFDEAEYALFVLITGVFTDERCMGSASSPSSTEFMLGGSR